MKAFFIRAPKIPEGDVFGKPFEELHVDPRWVFRKHFEAAIRNVEVASTGRIDQRSLLEISARPANTIADDFLLSTGEHELALFRTKLEVVR